MTVAETAVQQLQTRGHQRLLQPPRTSRGREESHPEPAESTGPCQHLDFRLMFSGTMRK